MFLTIVHADQVTLKEGTIIILKTMDHLTPKDVSKGDVVKCIVDEDVIVDGSIVIPEGAIATGDVSSSEEATFMGQPGKLGITAKTVKAIDQQIVQIRGYLQKSGKDKTVKAGVIAYICLFGLFMKGEEAVIPQGSLIRAYVDKTVTIEIEKPKN